MMIAQGYPEEFLAPMRDELTRLGFEELRTPELVDQAVARAGRRWWWSIRFAAAPRARRGRRLPWPLRDGSRPNHLSTVFAGGDLEATARAREHFAPYPPSSPSIALIKDGKLVYMMERRDIEVSTATLIADRLREAFTRYCA